MIEDLLKQGDKIADSYEVLSLLSKGRIGTVYKARDSFGQLYAVKIFGKEQTQNFPEYTNHLKEINRSLKVVLSKLAKFPNVSQVIEIGETEEYFFQVEEYIDAQSLDSVIKAEAPLNPTKALYVVAQLAEALHFLHSNSIIHADVKPTIILLYEPPPDALDKNLQVKLIDFGMAQKIESNQGILFVGTYRYIHPELKGNFRQDRNATTETSKSSFYMSSIGPYIDIYALGLVSLEMLTVKTQNSFPITESRI